jgi:phage-related minor tail protein
MSDDVTVSIRADTAPFKKALGELEELSERFGSELTGALRDAAIGGKALDEVLRKLALDLAGMALDQGLQPLKSLASSALSSLGNGLMGLLPFAKGGVVPFAGGGIVSAPTLFPAGNRLGLMGEAGAEAIMPLSRGPDGRLGVATASGGAPVSIIFNVSAPDPAAFAKSEAQIAQMLARTVSRGFRSL